MFIDSAGHAICFECFSGCHRLCYGEASPYRPEPDCWCALTRHAEKSTPRSWTLYSNYR